MKKYLVTGGTGLIGSHLLAALPPDCEVYAVSRSQNRILQNQVNVSQISVDFSANWSVEALPPKVDAVIHLAQSTHFREFPEKAIDIFQVNTFSTLRLLDYARQAGARTFVLASSGGVYANSDPVCSDDAALSVGGDLGFYPGSKLCAEILAENYTAYMNVVILRFFFVYGAGQSSSMLIPRLVHSVQEGRPIMLQGQDGIQINPTYVSDAVNAILRTLDLKDSHKINIGGPTVLSLRQIATLIGQSVGREPHFDVQSNIAPRNLIGDISKMTHWLGAPRIPFADGIQKYVTQEKILQK